MIEVGKMVNGTDMNGKEICNGTVTNILKVLQVAIVRTGEDRNDTTEADISNLRLT